MVSIDHVAQEDLEQPRSSPAMPEVQLDLEGANPEVKNSVESSHFVHPPSPEEAQLALNDINNILKPPRAKRRGYTDSNLDLVFC